MLLLADLAENLGIFLNDYLSPALGDAYFSLYNLVPWNSVTWRAVALAAAAMAVLAAALILRVETPTTPKEKMI